MDEFRSEVVDFLRQVIAADEACPAFGAILPPELHDRARTWQRTMFESGWAGLHWPERFGGRGLSMAHTTIWFEECARLDVAPYLNLQGIILAGEAILRSGSDAQREQHLPSTLSGETLWCQLFSEPDAGSDLASLRTAAVPDGDRFVVNGQKVWSSNAQFAEKAILMARTDDAAPAHRGITFFLLDMSTPGIEVRPITQMTGEQEFCEVFLQDVEVPADAVLGGRENGWAVAMQVLVDERGSFGAAGAISLERDLAALTDAASPDDAVQTDRLAGLLAEGRALMALLHRLGAEPTMAPAAKLLRTELSVRGHGLHADLRGPAAMLDDDHSRELLYSAGMRLAGGTSEVQRNIIAERLLGLPREPKVG
jgi:alkylation response protein AidB-like acyl-CoA dehydrogenase